ncbi:MAG: amidohydrolase [Verrucomicrobia bacterium]|nr:MAG: amidohydrolase [Verrucomicrobiota bacterium]
MKNCSLAIFLTSILAPLLAFGQPTPQSIANAELPSLLTIYKDIHSHPELSTKEQRSSAIVAKELRAAGCEVTENFGHYDNPDWKCYGVVGVMKNGDGPTVLVRTDMDALPVQEQTGASYASKVTMTNVEGKEMPVMHACGHDIHMSALIGTARALGKLKDKWHGTIVFIGQPAEEMVGGARAMLHAGLYDRFGKPAYAVALHDNAEIEAGKIGITAGYYNATVDSVDVTVKGMGGHGAYPHKTKDPITLSAEIINAWQTIASRENNPLDPIVVTVGSIHGGTKHNIIPDEVKMQLTVRTYKPEVRQRVLSAIEQIAKGCATAAGLPPDKMPEVNVLHAEHVNAVYNNPELTKRVKATLKSAIGDENVVDKDPTMAGDDFSEFSLPDHSIPACMFNVGAVDPAKAAEAKKTGASLPSLHSSKFLPLPEPTIRVGIIGMTSAVLDLMKK